VNRPFLLHLQFFANRHQNRSQPTGKMDETLQNLDPSDRLQVDFIGCESIDQQADRYSLLLHSLSPPLRRAVVTVSTGLLQDHALSPRRFVLLAVEAIGMAAVHTGDVRSPSPPPPLVVAIADSCLCLCLCVYLCRFVL
jgi:hypothetical protein